MSSFCLTQIPAIALLLTLSATANGRAEVKLNGIFTDNLVLQRDAADPIWGTAEPGESVTVDFAGQKKTTTADATGHWRVKLDPLAVSAENRVLTVSGNHSTAAVKVANILVGDVWFCAGQSNMEWGMARSTGGEADIANSTNPLLRMGRIPHNSQLSPATDVAVKWDEANPTTTKWFSAVPYYFGSKLQKELGVPVGIINNSYGGTRIESWLSEEVLKNGPWPQDKKSVMELAKAEYDQKLAAVKPQMDAYLAQKNEAIKNHLPVPPMFAGWVGDFRGPTVLWNGEVAPVLGYAIKGFIWNQGENNAEIGCSDRYFEMLKALARLYRESWGQGDFPIIVMQTATHGKTETDPGKPSSYAEIREGQLHFVQQDKNSILVVAVDQGLLNGDVHYPNKEPISERLTRAILGFIYGHPGEYWGPIYDSAEFKDGKAVIHFTHTGSGLMAKDGPLVDFAVAGTDKTFHAAQAVISGNTVVVSSPDVPEPVAVRYGWADVPVATPNLFNKEGYPASTFRTDNWSFQVPGTSMQTAPTPPPQTN